MAETMLDIGGFSGTFWQREIEKAIELKLNDRPLWQYVSNKMAPPGSGQEKVAIQGALTVTEYTKGSGARLVGQTGSQSTVTIDLDKELIVTPILDDIEVIQSAVDITTTTANNIVESLWNAVDQRIVDAFVAETGLETVTLAAPVSISTDGWDDVVEATDNLVNDAVAILKKTCGGGTAYKSVLLPNDIYTKMAKYSANQNRERTDTGLAFSSGFLNPIYGLNPLSWLEGADFGAEWSSYTNVTTVVMFAFHARAFAIAFQRLPKLELFSPWDLPAKVLRGIVGYGQKTIHKNAMVRIELPLAGNPYGLPDSYVAP